MARPVFRHATSGAIRTVGCIGIRLGRDAISSGGGGILWVVHRRPFQVAHQPKGDESRYQRLSSFRPEKLPGTLIHGFDGILVVPPQYRRKGPLFNQFDAATTRNRVAKRPRIGPALCPKRRQSRGYLEQARGRADAEVPDVELQLADRDHGVDSQPF